MGRLRTRDLRSSMAAMRTPTYIARRLAPATLGLLCALALTGCGDDTAGLPEGSDPAQMAGAPDGGPRQPSGGVGGQTGGAGGQAGGAGGQTGGAGGQLGGAGGQIGGAGGQLGGAGGSTGGAGGQAPITPPVQIVITEPARGARLQGEGAWVRGWVQGGVEPEISLRLEGVGADPYAAELSPDAQGDFEAWIPTPRGLSTLVVRGRDNATEAEDRRALLVGADADPDAAVSAFSVAISEAGFAQISDRLTQLINTVDLQPYFEANMPEGVRLDALRHGEIRLALRPRADLLNVRLEVDALHVALTGVVDLGVEIDFDGTADVDPLEVEARVSVRPSEDGALALEVLGVSVVLRRFTYDIPYVPEFAEGWFEDMVRSYLEASIADALRAVVIEQLFDPAALQRAVVFGDHTVEMGLTIESVTLTQPLTTVRLDGRAAVLNPTLRALTLPPLGGVATHAGGDPLDLAISLDFINRLLHGGWASGALDLTLDPTADPDAGLPDLQVRTFQGALGDAAAGLDPMAPVTLKTRPLLPPVADLLPDSDHPLLVRVPELHMELSTEGEVLAVVAVHVEARVALSAEDVDALDPELEVTVYADVVSTPRGPVNAARMELLVGQITQGVIHLVADQVFTGGADALPVPLSLEGGPASAEGSWLHMVADQL